MTTKADFKPLNVIGTKLSHFSISLKNASDVDRGPNRVDQVVLERHWPELEALARVRGVWPELEALA
jgi:hypothetical protein